MCLIDDVLRSPMKGILWMFQEIHDAAQEDQAGEKAVGSARSWVNSNEAGNRADHPGGVCRPGEGAFRPLGPPAREEKATAALRKKPGKPHPKAKPTKRNPRCGETGSHSLRPRRECTQDCDRNRLAVVCRGWGRFDEFKPTLILSDGIGDFHPTAI